VKKRLVIHHHRSLADHSPQLENIELACSTRDHIVGVNIMIAERLGKFAEGKIKCQY
jgi:hypothetical protein